MKRNEHTALMRGKGSGKRGSVHLWHATDRPVCGTLVSLVGGTGEPCGVCERVYQRRIDDTGKQRTPPGCAWHPNARMEVQRG